MRFGLNTFLYASPFTNDSVSMFKKLKKWGFDTVEVAIEDPAHVDPEEANTVPSPETIPFALPNETPGLADRTVDEKVDMARRIESCALRFSSRASSASAARRSVMSSSSSSRLANTMQQQHI